MSFLVSGCDANDPGTGSLLAADLAIDADGSTSEAAGTVIVSGTIATDDLWTSDNEYILDGIVDVADGATLTIEPGTVIKGSVNQPSALLIRQGAKIMAEGTETAPILFTSIAQPGSRTAGDWGGLIIIGKSTCNGLNNFPPDCVVEGVPNVTTFGGNPVDTADNSGVLRYVKIEFVGFELEPNSEINGLTLYSVGSGTTIENVHVHKASDDGVEIFGGTVDLKRIIVSGAQDDSFDYSYGWTGRAQFIVAIQDEDVGDRGIEADNNEIQNGSTDFFNEPLTNPTIYNATFIGRFPSGVGSDNIGFKLRRGVGGEIRNAIAVGFGSYGVDIDDDATFTNCDSDNNGDDLRVANMLTFDLGIAQVDPDADDEEACMGNGLDRVLNRNPRMRAISRTAPDFRPRSASLVKNPNLVADTPNDGFFEQADWIGAMDPDGTTGEQWYRGWTSYPQS